MGTRGFIGVVVNGEEKIAYQQYDSYPEGVGANFLTHISSLDAGGWEAFAVKAQALTVLGQDDTPTPEQIQRCKDAGAVDTGVGEQSLTDGYCLVRNNQGDIAATLDLGITYGDIDWPHDSLFCEYGYLVDLDTGTFEFYVGFQKAPHDKGRFADRNPDAAPSYAGAETYYPVALAGSWPIDALPTVEDLTAITETVEV